MSQHFYPATYMGQPVIVMMGYDRPLRGFFMVIESAGDSASAAPVFNHEEDDDYYVYSNLSDFELLNCCGLPKTTDHFLKRLQEMDITAHPNVITAIKQDQVENVGNKTVYYDMAGNELANQDEK